MMGIDGNGDSVGAVEDELFVQANQADQELRNAATGRLKLIRPTELHSESNIRLVSGFPAKTHATEGPSADSSDLAIADAARKHGLDQLLRGELIHATGQEDSVDRLSIVWRLIGLGPDAKTAGIPVSVDQESIAWQYPDLMNVNDPRARLEKAIVRKTISLLTVSVNRQRVDLAKPHLTLGSTEVRRGNDLAAAGNWPEAERTWVETLERHPGQTAAWINAAIAATARQDFSQGRQRATHAIKLAAISPANRSLAEETLVWIELRQRDYHEAFGLPDPPEGWRVTLR